MKLKDNKWIFSFEQKINPDICDIDIKDVYVTEFKNGRMYMSRVSDTKMIFITEGFTRHQVEIICNDIKGRRIRNLDFSTFEKCKDMFFK